MKKTISIIFLSGILLFPVAILAQHEAPELVSTAEDLIQLIENIGNWIFTALLAMAVIFLIVAGFFFITSGGNPEGVTKARQMLINALIGVAVALLAKGLVSVIGSLLGN